METIRTCAPRPKTSHGTGRFEPSDLAALGAGAVIEDGVLIFHPENVEIGEHVYVGHQTILKGYYRNRLIVGDGSWIGQTCFLHSAGGIRIGANVGIAPCVKILTSSHGIDASDEPILHADVTFEAVVLEDGCDVGVGAIILPGVTVGRGAQIGAGSVVTRDVPPMAVAAGSPARVLRYRTGS